MIKSLSFIILSLFSSSLFATPSFADLKVDAKAGTEVKVKKNPRVLMKTTLGDIEIELYEDKAPKTVENFLAYVGAGFYKGTIFHRVMSDFMIQGGGYTQDLTRKETFSPIKNEANNGLRNDMGTIAMARTNDPHSATAQFFINVANNTSLNYTLPTVNGWGYTVFGKVVNGMSVVNQIRTTPTQRYKMFANYPTQPIVIKDVSVIK